MGNPVARIGDTIDHGGPIITGSGTVFANGKSVARKGDKVMCAKHDLQYIVGGSTTVFADGKSVARIGDFVSCGARIVSGSPNVSAG